MKFQDEFNGLEVEYDVEEYDPGVHTYANGGPGYPPSGGGVEDYQIVGIVDAGELEEWVREDWQPRRIMERIDRWCFLFLLRHMDKLPAARLAKLDRYAAKLAEELWDSEIRDHCEEHYWVDIGGPKGEREADEDDWADIMREDR